MQLRLIMKENVEELIPAMLAWNKDELMDQVSNVLFKYRNTVYDASNMDQAKKDRAVLNKFTQALNDERIRIGRIYESPYKKFTSEVNEVITTVEIARKQIDQTIKQHEEEIRREKEGELKNHFAVQVKELRNLIDYDRISNDRWLNASYPLKRAKEEIDGILEKIRRELTTIEHLDNVEKSTIKAFYFRCLDLGAALDEHQRLLSEKERIAKINTGEQENKVYNLRFEVFGTKKQLSALSKFMKENGIDFKSISI